MRHELWSFDRLGACLPDPWQQCGGGTAIVPTVVMGLGNE
ncbi:hypothetical protein HMPREF9607_01200 [Cutibacterium modestum HL044PA1]|uniref:Uncharacterized protein n=1 Tax=Cutibacterium modestum HL044PA1 TaxID=765109 RepID=A0ABP2K6V6_9ACTN|nr:hypothetical protein HMPREF9607_01200 [Cutibacterium modestum HL044PA1]